MFGSKDHRPLMPNSRWMGKVNRLTASLAIAAFAAFASASSVLAASPSPSPALSSVLIAPTGSYQESTDPQYDGPVSIADYAGTDSLALAELKRDAFIDGYARTWVAPDQKHIVAEEVIAFGGHRNATSWLTTYKGMTTSQYLVRPISADGIDSFFGGHYAEPSRPLYFDLGVFIKGNDFFSISALSQADDLGDTATAQSKRLFDSAPAYSISPNQWPENAGKSSFNFGAAALPLAVGGGVVIVVILLVALAVVVVVVTRGRTSPAPAAAAEGPLMSQDGSYWWDGQAWRDASREVPPDALRSADGYYWWDSRSWRPLPPPS